jgi:proliferating cell nuclear antigen
MLKVMLLKLDNPKVLADAISVISELVLEVKAKVTKKGFEIIAIDPANVALVVLKIPSNVFSQYSVDKEEELGLNLEDFKQVLKRIGSSLTIERKENTLKLRTHEGAKRAFSLSLIEVEQEDRKIPELNFDTKIEIPSSTFSDVINDALVVADSASLITNKEKDTFTVHAKGTLNQAKTEFDSDEIKLEAQDSKSKYSLEYLAKFVKASRMAPKLAINYSSDYPARFDFLDPETKVELSFILAPRVEEE